MKHAIVVGLLATAASSPAVAQYMAPPVQNMPPPVQADVPAPQPDTSSQSTVTNPPATTPTQPSTSPRINAVGGGPSSPGSVTIVREGQRRTIPDPSADVVAGPYGAPLVLGGYGYGAMQPWGMTQMAPLVGATIPIVPPQPDGFMIRNGRSVPNAPGGFVLQGPASSPANETLRNPYAQ